MPQPRYLSNPSPADMPQSADVVIIGGGPAGAAALWALARADPALRIILVERSAQIGAGASNASLENFRTCWPTPCLAALMRRSIDVFLNADAHFGDGAQAMLGVKQQGYAYCGFTDAQVDALRADAAHLHAIGLAHVECVEGEALRERFGWLGERVRAIKYDPVAGWLDSHALINLFARNGGNATILLDIADVELETDGGRVTGVRTPNGRISAPHVVLAAGANARRMARTAGVDVPIVVRPRQSFTTPYRHAAYPQDGPCVIAASPFPHCRPEARDGLIFGWEYGWRDKRPNLNGDYGRDALIDPDDTPMQFRDPRFPSLTLALLARQFGHAGGEGFSDPRYLRGIDHRAGYYVYRANAYTTGADGVPRPYDSQRAIIDTHPELDGLHLSVAHVGHGIMSSPAAGEIIAAKVLGQPLPDPAYADFGFGVSWVEHDTGGLGKSAAD